MLHASSAAHSAITPLSARSIMQPENRRACIGLVGATPCSVAVRTRCGISLEVSQRGARSVRATEEIELFVTERCPDFVHIVHRDVGCVELQIGFRFELCAALANVFERKEVTEIALEIGWVVRTSQLSG